MSQKLIQKSSGVIYYMIEFAAGGFIRVPNIHWKNNDINTNTIIWETKLGLHTLENIDLQIYSIQILDENARTFIPNEYIWRNIRGILPCILCGLANCKNPLFYDIEKKRVDENMENWLHPSPGTIFDVFADIEYWKQYDMYKKPIIKKEV